MPEPSFATPLLGPDSPLDEHSRQLIQSIYEKEQAKALVQPTDDPLDPKRHRMVEHTWTEIWVQPGILQKNLETERNNSHKAGDPLFLTAPDGPSVPTALDTAREGRRQGGQVYSVVDQNNRALDEASNRVFEVARVPESLAPFTHTMPLQLFAYYAAAAKFQRAEEKAKLGI